MHLRRLKYSLGICTDTEIPFFRRFCASHPVWRERICIGFMKICRFARTVVLHFLQDSSKIYSHHSFSSKITEFILGFDA